MAEWSDGRLDEFAIRVDERFDRLDEKFDERLDRVDGRFAEVDRRFDEVDRRFAEVGRRLGGIEDRQTREFGRINDRLDDLVKVMIAGVLTLTGAILAGFIGIIALVATQL